MNLDCLIEELIDTNIIQINKKQLVNPNAERKLIKNNRYDILDAISNFSSYIESLQDKKISLKIMVIYKYKFLSSDDIPICENNDCNRQVNVISGANKIIGKFCSKSCSLYHKNKKSKTKIDEETGLTISKLNSIKSRKTLEETIDEETGLTLEKLRGSSVSDSLKVLTESGKTIAQERATKEAKRRSSTIDPTTNKTLTELYGERSYLKNLENGHYDTIGQKLKNFYETENGKLVKKEQSKKQRSTVIGKNSTKILTNCEKKRYKIYRNRVKYYTNKNSLNLENIELRASNKENENAYHIDHKFSIAMGFELNIPPYIIGSSYNLEILHWKENLKKGAKCSISLDNLLANY